MPDDSMTSRDVWYSPTNKSVGNANARALPVPITGVRQPYRAVLADGAQCTDHGTHSLAHFLAHCFLTACPHMPRSLAARGQKEAPASPPRRAQHGRFVRTQPGNRTSIRERLRRSVLVTGRGL